VKGFTIQYLEVKASHLSYVKFLNAYVNHFLNGHESTIMINFEMDEFNKMFGSHISNEESSKTLMHENEFI